MTHRHSIPVCMLGLLLGALPAQEEAAGEAPPPYEVEISTSRRSIFPHQEVELTLTLERQGEGPGPAVDRAVLTDMECILCASPPTDGEGARGPWRGEYAIAADEGAREGSIALHDGETFTTSVLIRIPESVREDTRVVYVQWKGRHAPLEDVQSNQLVLNLQDGTKPIATLETGEGTIVIELWPDKAPNHVANFVRLARKDHYDGLIFHRVIRNFMIQTGCPEGTGRGGPGYTIPDEFNDTSFRKGIVGMAKTAAPDSAGSQFFIMVADKPSLDGNYTAFGRVLEGQDVADRISQVPTHTSGAQKDRPRQEVRLESVRVALPKGYEPPEVEKSS